EPAHATRRRGRRHVELRGFAAGGLFCRRHRRRRRLRRLLEPLFAELARATVARVIFIFIFRFALGGLLGRRRWRWWRRRLAAYRRGRHRRDLRGLVHHDRRILGWCCRLAGLLVFLVLLRGRIRARLRIALRRRLIVEDQATRRWFLDGDLAFDELPVHALGHRHRDWYAVLDAALHD